MSPFRCGLRTERGATSLAAIMLKISPRRAKGNATRLVHIFFGIRRGGPISGVVKVRGR